MIKALTTDGVINLCRAILAQADADLRHQSQKGDCEFYAAKELHNFYHGPLFASFGGDIDPDAYMREVLARKRRVSKPYMISLSRREVRNAAV